MNELLAFIKENTTVIFTLVGILTTQLLSRWNLSKQLREQHQSAIARDWNQEIRKVLSELNISCRVMFSYRAKPDGIMGKDWERYTEEKEKAFSRIASLQILLDRKKKSHIPLWNELAGLTQLLTSQHYSAQDLGVQTDKIVEATQDLLNNQ